MNEVIKNEVIKNEVIKNILDRRSVRNYTEEKVSKQMLEQLSWRIISAWRYTVSGWIRV